MHTASLQLVAAEEVEHPFLVGVPSEVVGGVILGLFVAFLLIILAFGKGRPHP